MQQFCDAINRHDDATIKSSPRPNPHPIPRPLHRPPRPRPRPHLLPIRRPHLRRRFPLPLRPNHRTLRPLLGLLHHPLPSPTPPLANQCHQSPHPFNKITLRPPTRPFSAPPQRGECPAHISVPKDHTPEPTSLAWQRKAQPPPRHKNPSRVIVIPAPASETKRPEKPTQNSRHAIAQSPQSPTAWGNSAPPTKNVAMKPQPSPPIKT